VKLIDAVLGPSTAALASGCNVVCAFVNDVVSAEVLDILAELGVKAIAMRCAGFDRVDLKKASELGIVVLRVPAYSPYAVAEHAVTLMMALNRQIIKAAVHARMLNYDLSGLVGFDMHGKTVGVVGSGKIGRCTAAILIGMGCKVLTFDPYENQEAKDMGMVYVSLDELLTQSSIITLHCPLMPSTKHIINAETIAKMKPGVMLINTSRGGLVDTAAVIDALDSRQIGALGTDVYESEGGLFFSNPSAHTDDTPGASLPREFNKELSALVGHPNVIVTPHMAFLTQDALVNIAKTTVLNLTEFAKGGPYTNLVKA
jgi:D-lactate dehydrogenase